MRDQNTAKITRIVIILNQETDLREGINHRIGWTEMGTLMREKDLPIEEIGRKGVEVETETDKEEIEINEIEVEVRKEDNMIEKEADLEREGEIDLKYLSISNIFFIVILPKRKYFSVFCTRLFV